MCASPPQQPSKVTPPPRTRQHAGQLPQRPACHTNASVLRGAAHAHTRVHPSARGGGAESPWVCAECNARLWVGRQHCTAVRAPYPTHRTTALQPRVHRRATHACVQCTNRALGGWGVDVCWGGAVLGVTAEGPAALRVPPPIWFAGGGADGRSHRIERRGRRAAVTLDPHHPPTPQHRRRGDHRGWEGCMGGEVTPLPLLSPPPRPSLAPGD